jgi:hypothetical protein
MSDPLEKPLGKDTVMLMKKLCKAVRFAVLTASLSAIFVSVGVAQQASPVVALRRFNQYQGRYGVSFPITMKYEPQIHTPAPMWVDADIDGVGYAVICEDLQNAGPAEKAFDELDAIVLRTNRARVVRQTAITLGSFSGRELELENDNGWQRICREYLVGTRLYCVAVQARDRKLNREMAKDFLDSFTLLEGNAPAPTVMPAPSPAPSAAPAPPADAPQVSPPQSFQWPDPAPSAPQSNGPTADHRYTNRDGRYFVDFPGTPTESERQLPNGATLHQALMEVQGVAYLVSYCDMPAWQLEQARARSEGLAAFYTAWRDDIMNQTHATLQHDGSVRVAGREAYGAEFVLPDGTHVIGRMAIVGTRAYRIALIGAGITADSALVRQYLDSFGVIE